jgi:hypothetical protein
MDQCERCKRLEDALLHVYEIDRDFHANYEPDCLGCQQATHLLHEIFQARYPAKNVKSSESGEMAVGQ